MATKTFTTTKDASMLESNDGWSGWDNHHPVGISSSGNRYRSVIYFPVNFTGMTAITSASIFVRGHRAGSGNHVFGDQVSTRTLNVDRMTADWGEGTNRGETLWSASEVWGWTNRATAHTSTGRGQRVFTTYSEGTWYEIDITSIVQAWFDGSPNYGVMLYIDGSFELNDARALEFYARDQGSTYAPYLVVNYSTNTAPAAPVNLSPTADALVNTLNPTLTGTRSDPDASDYLSAFQIIVYADDGTTVIHDTGTVAVSGTTNSTFSYVYGGPALSGGLFYKWKARTRDLSSAWGPYSALQRFKTNTPPNPPTLSIVETPVNDLKTLTPTLVVTHSDNDASDTKMYGYNIVLETDTGTAVWASGDIDTSGSPLTVLSLVYSGPALSYAQGYRFKARTKDQNGVWGNYSGYFNFATHTTAIPVSLLPDGDTISGLTPTFYGTRGDSSDSLTSYQIIVYANDQQTVIWDSGVLTSGITNGSQFQKAYAGTALSYSTTYYWKARVTSTIGGTSAYSVNKQFTTPADATVPVQSLPTPNNSPTNNNVTSLTPTFSASRNSTFTNYQVELYPATATATNLGTPIWDSGNLSQAAATSFSVVYNGPPLAWATTYKWRTRVGSPALGSYTGLASFQTDAAGTPTLTAPADNSWLTSSPITFSGSSSGGDSIIAVRFLFYTALANGTKVLAYDTGDLSQTASTTFSKSLTIPNLQTGVTYLWQARYTKSTGVTGGYSTLRSFHMNAIPSVPGALSPVPGDILANTLFPVFKATFDDLDRNAYGDYPTAWVIEVRNNATDAIVQTKSITTNLVSGPNTYSWTSSDAALSYNTEYKWRTWFVDSKGATGAASSFQIFRAGQSPSAAITSPSNGSNVNTTKPTITWTYSGLNGKPQLKYDLWITRDLTGAVIYRVNDKISDAPSASIPTGYLTRSGENYTVHLVVYDAECLPSSEVTSGFQLALNAPPAIAGLSGTVYEDQSKIVLDWDKSALGSSFVTYVIYRKLPTDSEWTMIGTTKPESNVVFTDYYAGQAKTYQYRVTVVKLISSEPDLESPDSDIVTAKLESDVWMVVGADRNPSHIFEVPVTDESHTRPVQQEVFEPLGSNRKAVIRGFVLGHEGSFTALWPPEEAADAVKAIEYVLYYPGPHILKDPFGNVYDVTFAGPDYAYTVTGPLTVTITWIEVGVKTNNPGLSPDEYLAQIGAQ